MNNDEVYVNLPFENRGCSPLAALALKTFIAQGSFNHHSAFKQPWCDKDHHYW